MFHQLNPSDHRLTSHDTGDKDAAVVVPMQ